MKTRILWALAGLNVLLLAMFLSNYVRDNQAHAQGIAAAGRPGEYIICPGAITGISSEVVYVIDTLNGTLGAVVFDTNTGRLDTMPAEDLNRVFQAGNPPQGLQAPGQPGTLPQRR